LLIFLLSCLPPLPTRPEGDQHRAGPAHRVAAHQGAVDQYGLSVEPDALVGTLPVGIQQRVEILKTLYRQAEILILDEPTAVLTPQETDELFEIMRSLQAEASRSSLSAQAEGGDDHRRPGRRAAQWPGGGRDDAGRDSKSSCGDDGGARGGAGGGQGPASPGEVVLEVSGLTAIDRRQQQACAAWTCSCASARCWGWPGAGQRPDGAGGGAHRASHGHRRLDPDHGPRRDQCPPRQVTELGVAHIPKTGSATG